MSKNLSIESEENPFALSIGDLMASLLLVFILLLSATLLQLEEEFKKKKENLDEAHKIGEKITEIANTYKTLQNDLYNDLYIEFKDDLKKWQAVIDRKTLSIRFLSPEVLFEQGKADVKDKFKDILNDFFPRYLKKLDKYKDNIEEIRIEGHTSSEWSKEVDENTSYFKNMELSQDRTRSVLEYCLDIIKNKEVKEWSRSKITANGLSFSKRIFNNNNEDKELSRRVEFRVRTDSEKRIGKILGVGKKD
jgi:outer membrane protein OmpA-like peptidoglycan-associated protein